MLGLSYDVNLACCANCKGTGLLDGAGLSAGLLGLVSVPGIGVSLFAGELGFCAGSLLLRGIPSTGWAVASRHQGISTGISGIESWLL